MSVDKIGGARQLIQDLLAPAVSRLEEKVTNVSEECVRLAKDIESNRGEIKEVWQAVRDSNEKVARAEGRLENVKAEVIATVKMELMKQLQQNDHTALPHPTASEDRGS